MCPCKSLRRPSYTRSQRILWPRQWLGAAPGVSLRVYTRRDRQTAREPRYRPSLYRFPLHPVRWWWLYGCWCSKRRRVLSSCRTWPASFTCCCAASSLECLWRSQSSSTRPASRPDIARSPFYVLLRPSVCSLTDCFRHHRFQKQN